MPGIERKNSTKDVAFEREMARLYKERILAKLGEDNGQVMTAAQLAEEFELIRPVPGIRSSPDYYYFINALTSLEGRESKEHKLVKQQILLARMPDGDFGYYRKSDEEALVNKGILGPEYEVGPSQICGWEDFAEKIAKCLIKPI